MTIGTRNLEFLHHNAQRAYPLAMDSSRIDITGSFTLPDDFIVNLSLPVHWGLNVLPARFLVHRIVSSAGGFEITIGYDNGVTISDVAVARIARATHTVNKSYVLLGLGSFSGSRGFVAIGDLGNIDRQPSGSFEFDLDGGLLEVDAIRPHIRGVTSLQVQNGGDLSVRIDGNVIFRAGPNMRITPILEVGEDPVIVFDAREGAGLDEECVCNANQSPPVRTLLGVGPDSSGNIDLLGNACFNITPAEHALVIRDTCSEPCCGCKELEEITRSMESFGSTATTLENFLVDLKARVDEMELTVLGSRLGDRGCVPAPDCPP
jgi:hypothetical protein